MSLFLETIFVSALVATGAALQSSVGIGLGLIAGPLLMIINPSYVPGPLLLAGFWLAMMMAYRERQSIDMSGVKIALGGRIVGIALASAVVIFLPADRMSILFGMLVLLAAMMSLSNIQIQPTLIGITIAGILSGFMSTLSGMGGPPMALLYQNTSGSRLRSTLSGYYVVGLILSIISLIIVGRFGTQELRLFLMMFPGIIIGFLFSHRFIAFLDNNKLTKKSIITVSSISALIVIAKVLLK